ncbi:AraC family transcriptional regulator ligand-binding domain-containing protein [Roseibium sp.]|uniref:AraC family transcriptional regulator n=1 Tax=Roseibium sp. TaxID=1936156 RepID=UPI003A96A4D4
MSSDRRWTRSEILASLRKVLPKDLVDWSELAHEFNFDLSALDTADGIVPMAATNAVFEYVANALGDEGRLFDLFYEIPIGQYSLYDYLFVCAPTVRDACKAWHRFMPMRSNAVSLTYSENDEEGRLEWSQLDDDGLHMQIMFARFGWALKRIETVLGVQPAPVRAELAFPAPRQTSKLEQLYRERMAFDASRNAIHLPRNLLDRRTLRNEESLYAILLRQASDELEFHSSQGSILTRTAEAIANSMTSGTTNLPRVARDLGMSERSLQRALEREGTSFRKMTEDIRRSAANRYLANTHLSMKEIAFLLGFSESSTFSKAYRDWFGISPNQYRRSHVPN